jgi:hypothetical protein
MLKQMGGERLYFRHRPTERLIHLHLKICASRKKFHR